MENESLGHSEPEPWNMGTWAHGSLEASEPLVWESGSLGSSEPGARERRSLEKGCNQASMPVERGGLGVSEPCALGMKP